MTKYEVAKALWDEVYQWATNRPADVRYSFEHGAQGKATNHPAQYMSWYDAVKWCNARSEKRLGTDEVRSPGEWAVLNPGPILTRYSILFKSGMRGKGRGEQPEKVCKERLCSHCRVLGGGKRIEHDCVGLGEF